MKCRRIFLRYEFMIHFLGENDGVLNQIREGLDLQRVSMVQLSSGGNRIVNSGVSASKHFRKSTGFSRKFS